jgi:intracellular sulfur oxidation DsrE/DsrF family protein
MPLQIVDFIANKEISWEFAAMTALGVVVVVCNLELKLLRPDDEILYKPEGFEV